MYHVSLQAAWDCTRPVLVSGCSQSSYFCKQHGHQLSSHLAAHMQALRKPAGRCHSQESHSRHSTHLFQELSRAWLCPVSPPDTGIRRALQNCLQRGGTLLMHGCLLQPMASVHQAGRHVKRRKWGSKRNQNFLILSVFPHLFSGKGWLYARHSKSVLHSSCSKLWGGRFTPVW